MKIIMHGLYIAEICRPGDILLLLIVYLIRFYTASYEKKRYLVNLCITVAQGHSTVLFERTFS